MPAPNSISCEKLGRLIGLPDGPTIVDVRTDNALRIPGAVAAGWPADITPSAIVVVDEDGGAVGHGSAARLRSEGFSAEVLDGGFTAWRAAGLPVINAIALPERSHDKRTWWVTRARPKVDRIACPWLIRRFIDPFAGFLYVPAAEVSAVAREFGATPFDIEAEGVRFTHRDELCSFDALLADFSLDRIAPLSRLATIVRGADTGRPDLAPEAAGLLAISLGLSRTYADDLAQFEAGMGVYDALYRWCRDASGETHDWTSHQAREPRS